MHVFQYYQFIIVKVLNYPHFGAKFQFYARIFDESGQISFATNYMTGPTLCENLVKIGPAVSEISCALTYAHTYVRTYVRTHGLTHRKLIVGYP